MFNVKTIINSNRGRYVLSILLGLGLATLFRKACDSRNCLIFKAASLKSIKNKVFGFNDKCYKYTEKNSTCNENKDNIVLQVE